MILFHILAATLVGGALSVMAAASLSMSLLKRLVQQLVSLSVGLLLGTSVLQLMPEAFESDVDPHALGWTLLVGLVGFFLLEKLAILRHSHHHEGDGHDHHHGHDHHEAGPGGMLILIGDSIHNFTDGVLIAAAFLTDVRLGWLTTLAIAAHEIPQEIGDFIVLLNAGYSRSRAFVYNLLSGLAAVVGGVCGYVALENSRHLVPYAICLAAASFIYIALADLIPDMHRQSRRHAAGERLRDSLVQVVWMLGGIAIIAVVSSLVHHHH